MVTRNLIAALVLLSTVAPSGSMVQLASSPWPMYQHDERHSGKSEYPGPEYPAIAWSYSFEGIDDPVPGDIAIGSDGTL